MTAHAGWGAALLAVLVARELRAEPRITPPRVIHEEPAAYPAGAEGSASVVVEVVVDQSGLVVEATLVSGDAPFAETAVNAVRRWRFEPARRDGEPVRARIRALVQVKAPPEVATTPGSRTPDVQAPRPPAREIEDITVTGHREPHTPTEHRMGREEVRVVPGAFGDPFRAIDILPSLVPIISGLPYFYVRGAPPSAVGYYVDEVRVPYLFHFALGPGVIQPALIEEVALHPAAYPARFGRFAGGIVAGKTRDPATELRGEGQVRVIDAGAYIEAPLADGRATVGVGGRYSYTAAILSLFAKDVTIDYRDYNARATYALSDRWRASLLAFGSFDYASNKEDGVERVAFASEFHRLDLRLDHRGADGATSRVAATVGIDRTRLEDARFAQNIVTGIRGRHRQPVSKELELELGADVQIDNYGGDLPNRYAVSRDDYENAFTLFSPRVETATGAWVSASYAPRPKWDLTATMRADLFTSAGKVAVGPSPRASMYVPLASRIAFLGAIGIAPQPPAFAVPIPAVGYRGLPGGLAFAFQKSAGLELSLPWRFSWRVVGFHHSYANLPSFSDSRENFELDEEPRALTPSLQSFGVESMLSRKLSERFSAYVSTTITRAQMASTRLFPTRVSPFDRTYVLQVGGLVDLGRHWRASARVVTYGGWPTEVNGSPGGGRLSPFWRIDARIEKRWVLGEHRYIGLVFEGLNVTASKDIVGRTCEATGCREDRIGPIVVPSIGVEGAL